MKSNAEALLKDMCIPEYIITQVLQITQKEEEAVNLALEFMENPQPALASPVQPKSTPPPQSTTKSEVSLNIPQPTFSQHLLTDTDQTQ